MSSPHPFLEVLGEAEGIQRLHAQEHALKAGTEPDLRLLVTRVHAVVIVHILDIGIASAKRGLRS